MLGLGAVVRRELASPTAWFDDATVHRDAAGLGIGATAYMAASFSYLRGGRNIPQCPMLTSSAHRATDHVSVALILENEAKLT